MTLPAFCNSLTANSSENLSAALTNATLEGNFSQPAEAGITIKDVKNVAYLYITPVVCLIGVCGNTLNLVTLRSHALQTVPFMYIRLVAVFDLLALSMILISSFGMGNMLPYHWWLVFYQAHVELVMINTFLTASLYCALVLTIERYILISHPHLRSASDPKRLAQIKIGCAFLLALLLHVPMIMLYDVNENDDTATCRSQQPPCQRYVKASNPKMLCFEPSASIYHYYTQSRECVRLAAVVIMSVLNGVIARKLQIAKQNRRRMTLKQQKARVSSSDRKELALLKSFTEKKLTVLMIAICIIYLIGNLPQAVIMVLHTDAMESKFGFQVFRAFGNVCEVLNHCLNFYVFCIASTEYSRAFLQNFMCMRSLLVRIPCCARILLSRKPSAASEGASRTSVALRPEDLVRSKKNADTSPSNSSIILNDISEKDLVYL